MSDLSNLISVPGAYSTRHERRVFRSQYVFKARRMQEGKLLRGRRSGSWRSGPRRALATRSRIRMKPPQLSSDLYYQQRLERLDFRHACRPLFALCASRFSAWSAFADAIGVAQFGILSSTAAVLKRPEHGHDSTAAPIGRMEDA